MPTYSFIDETDTIIKVVEDGVEILYKKVYCTTDYSGNYFYFMAHELETGKMIQQYSLLYTDCSAPVAASAAALKTAVDLIIDSYASATGGGVASVTGLDTDNTDPANPVVQIAVDGVTITGDGTSGNPLVSSGSGVSVNKTMAYIAAY